MRSSLVLLDADRGDVAAIRAEGDGGDPVGVAAQAAHFALGLHVPDADNGIGPDGGDVTAVRCERDACQR